MCHSSRKRSQSLILWRAGNIEISDSLFSSFSGTEITELTPETHREEVGSIFVNDNAGTREEVTIGISLPSDSFKDGSKTLMSVSVSLTSPNYSPLSGLNAVTSGIPEKYRTIDTNSNLTYNGEEFGPVLTGLVLRDGSLPPGRPVLLYLTLPGKIPVFQYTYSDETGKFRFLLPMNRGLQELIIYPSDKTENWLIKAGSPFSERRSDLADLASSWTADYLHFLEKAAINFQLNKIYNQFKPYNEEAIVARVKPKRFYGKPDIELSLEDYVSLPTMEEVFAELIPGVELKQQKDSTRIGITHLVTSEKLSHPGLVILDGIIIRDFKIITSLDPDLIEKVEVIKGDYQIGNLVFRGIVSIISKEGDGCGADSPETSFRSNYKILDIPILKENLSYADTMNRIRTNS